MNNIIDLIVEDMTRRGYFINPSKIKTSMLNCVRNFKPIAEEHDKDVWNEAIKAAAENAKSKVCSAKLNRTDDDYVGITGKISIQHIVDKDSILKLLK